MMNPNFIEVKNVSKAFCCRVKQGNRLKAFLKPKYETFYALQNINLNISKGEIFALLGPNGAGKTTLIKILCGLLSPTEGEVHVGGELIEYNKARIGLMLGSSMIYYRLTGYDNLKYFAKLYRLNGKDCERRIEELGEALKLGNWMNEYVEHYSTGMKAKLALARALIHNPDIVILDEPTAGLDVAISFEIRKRIKAMNKTVFLTTHNMSEVEELASRVAFLNHGRICEVDTQTKLKGVAKLEDAFFSLSNTYEIPIAAGHT